MESIVAVFHRWQAWACEQLHIAKRCIEVEVACRRSQGLSCGVAQRNFDVVCSTVDIFADVEEERIVAAPVSSNLHVINIDVCALVSVLEPQVSWLLSFKYDRCLKCKRSL